MALVSYKKYEDIKLKPKGRTVALEVVRHHRLLETFLNKVLGYGLHEVHAEADELEHTSSEGMEEPIVAMLGHPTHAPHCSPMPGKDGELEAEDSDIRSLVPLTRIMPENRATIIRLLHRRPELLHYLEELGLAPEKHFLFAAKKRITARFWLKQAGIRKSI